MLRDRRLVLAIMAGGFTGSVLRAVLADRWVHDPTSWPWATFVVNVLGAFLLGFFVTRLQERLALTVYQRPLLGTGFCGGLTTFSTMQLEVLWMLDHDAVGLAATYLAASVLAGIAAVLAATQVARRGRLA
ncbi:fluoride efflux transporter CrcB [Patulibacter sp. S7RM1-6]